MTPAVRGATLAALALGCLAAALLFVPRTMPSGYHLFADTRTLLGVPNANDVLSNAGFLLAGTIGVFYSLRPSTRFADRRERFFWALVFAGFALTAAGSAYYHLAPDDARLFWDRLPMSLVFGSLAGIVVVERIGPRLGLRLFAPIVLFCLLSVVVWRAADDLRLYAFAQYFPALALPLLIALYPPRYTHGAAFAAVLGCYGLSKVCEVLDRPIYQALGFVSGHTLKHLVAALGAAILIAMMRARRPVGY